MAALKRLKSYMIQQYIFSISLSMDKRLSSDTSETGEAVHILKNA